MPLSKTSIGPSVRPTGPRPRLEVRGQDGSCLGTVRRSGGDTVTVLEGFPTGVTCVFPPGLLRP